MDEGTAHLDLETEKEVNTAVSELGITRIIVAHRPETVKSADRRLVFNNGVVTEMPLADGTEQTGEREPLSVA